MMANKYFCARRVVCSDRYIPNGIVYRVNCEQILKDYTENGIFDRISFLSNLSQDIDDMEKYLKYHLIREQSDDLDYLLSAMEELYLTVDVTGQIPHFIQISLKDAEFYAKPAIWFRDDDVKNMVIPIADS